jgi:hypothetical protein
MGGQSSLSIGFRRILRPGRIARIYLLFLSALMLIFAREENSAEAAAKKSTYIPIPIIPAPTDPNTTQASPDAVQMAEILGLTEKLKLIQDLRSRTGKGETPSPESRQEATDAKIEVLAIVEEARLDVDFVSAEIEEELAASQELLHVFASQRDNRINRMNAYGFRVNGVLWAICEALDIPTYKAAKYSIPSGTIGILAGLVPSAFSLYALREPDARFARLSYPNMLSKLFDYPTIPRIEFPKNVWSYLNSNPVGEADRTRRDIMIDYWLHDKYINLLVGRSKTPDLDTLTGFKQNNVTIRMLSDRLTMLRQTRAVVMGMNRPLLEVIMVMRGTKSI